jgi:hypothetical protein
MRIVSTAGWWLALCDRTQPRTLSELPSHPRRVVGLVAIAAGLAGQFYFGGRR